MRNSRILLTHFLSIAALLINVTPNFAMAEPRHAIAMHGEAKFSENLTHFPYANPNAPKGGRVTLGRMGSFDSLNPMIIKGTAAAGLREYVYESLLTRGLDEPFTMYGLLAERIEVPDDRSSITFHLNPRAKFSDGAPVTSKDVKFSFEVLRDKGRPNHRTYYKKVSKVEVVSDRVIRFVFNADGDREMPLIMGYMPILPSHLLTPETFAKTTLSPPIGSGPYIVRTVDPGRSIVYERDQNWWGRDLPINRGRHNFNEVRFEYFREASVLFEAFKVGAIDLRSESDPARWAEGYSFPAAKDGRILKREIDIGLPAGMTALVFNTRREKFKDPRVRLAFIHLFDFEWINRNLFHGLYQRTQSYFSRSALSSFGHQADDRERELLSTVETGKIPPSIMEGRNTFPKSAGDGQNRKNWRTALKLFNEAGYVLKDRKLVNEKTGQQLKVSVLAATPALERLLLGFKKDLARLGIELSIRVVDSAQYQLRRKTYDFDMIQFTWRSSLSPGNEQLFRWSQESAKSEGSFNIAGVSDPDVDRLIQAMLQAKTSENFISAVRALDRVLLAGHYAIPLFHLPKQWLAHWAHLQSPETTPLFGYQLSYWWHRDAKTAVIAPQQ